MATPQQVQTLADLCSNTNAPILRSDNAAVIDGLSANCAATLIDNINAAWNGWEQACRYEDEDMQAYYMKYVFALNKCLGEIRKIRT